MFLPKFLAYLSQRLMDELIVYQSIWRPSVCPQFQTSSPLKPIKFKLHMETPKDAGTKVCSNGPGLMTKMAATPIYGKNPLKIFFSRTRRLIPLGLGMKHWGSGAYQVCSNDDPRLTLTYLTSRSNLPPNAFKWENF